MSGRFKQALLEKGDMSGLTQKGGHKRPTEKGAGLTPEGVRKYRRQNPGSKLKTAVTTPPSKLKPGSKAAKRRKSFCARSRGWTGERGKAARRRWNCSTDVNPNALQQMAEMIVKAVREGKTTGGDAYATGERVGAAETLIQQGKAKRGRRGAGETRKVRRNGKTVIIKQPGEPKTDDEIKAQVARLRRRVPRHAAKFGSDMSLMMKGAELENFTRDRGDVPQEAIPDLIGAQVDKHKEEKRKVVADNKKKFDIGRDIGRMSAGGSSVEGEKRRKKQAKDQAGRN